MTTPTEQRDEKEIDELRDRILKLHEQAKGFSDDFEEAARIHRGFCQHPLSTEDNLLDAESTFIDITRDFWRVTLKRDLLANRLRHLTDGIDEEAANAETTKKALAEFERFKEKIINATNERINR